LRNLCVMNNKTLVVIGGGAAGFFCAVNAARMNPLLKVIIVEKSSKLLSKVRVSGGGRCNVTHACFDINELIKFYPRGKNFLKKTFHWFNPANTIQWFEERGVQLKTEGDGRIFPATNNSETIIHCLLSEANKYGVEIILQTEVTGIVSEEEGFSVQLSNNRSVQAGFICVACGGFAKAEQFGWLKQLGHSIELPVPSLFTFNVPDNAVTQLMGVAVPGAGVKITGTKLSEEGALLITHWGFSGPAVLRLSAWGARELADRNYHFTILINWLTDYNEHSLREEWPMLRQQYAANRMNSKNPFGLPNRLWLYLLSIANIKEEWRWADVPVKEQNLLIQSLTAQNFEVKGKTTFKEEFVTCGGIKLNEIDANTMQSKLKKGVFFAGEIMDVDGITGGFNFQHAWTSGWIAAKAISGMNNG